MIYIIAGRRELAEQYAKKLNLDTRQWRGVSSVASIRGIKDGETVILGPHHYARKDWPALLEHLKCHPGVVILGEAEWVKS
jgi:hypothetical protein